MTKDVTRDLKPTQVDKADLLYGMPSIASFMGMKAPQARHLASKGTLPTFKIGKLVCSRRSTLLHWLAEQEQRSGSST